MESGMRMPKMMMDNSKKVMKKSKKVVSKPMDKKPMSMAMKMAALRAMRGC